MFNCNNLITFTNVQVMEMFIYDFQLKMLIIYVDKISTVF